MPDEPPRAVPENILELRDVRTHFPIHRGFLVKRQTGAVRAVDGVTLSVRQGEVLGLVGESGCGKSTLARTILHLIPATSGAVILNGRNLGQASRTQLLACRRDLQMVFQDPYASLNPRMTVRAMLAEPLLAHRICGKKDVQGRVDELMRIARTFFTSDRLKDSASAFRCFWSSSLSRSVMRVWPNRGSTCRSTIDVTVEIMAGPQVRDGR